MSKGLVHVYCGEGKGKTTAAIGLGIRGLGSNLKVIMIQCLKNSYTAEEMLLSELEPEFKIFHFGKDRQSINQLSENDRYEIKQEIVLALKFAKKVMDNMECEVLILDEILAGVSEGYIDEEVLKELIEQRTENVDLVLTGKQLPENLVPLVNHISKIDDLKKDY